MYRTPSGYAGPSAATSVPYANRLAPPNRGQPFSIEQVVSSLNSTASNLASSSSIQGSSSAAPNAFRAPAHKSSHFLHSIPPREKSTRTLIVDHMLWIHGRTRFAQARAELGMTDRTGGPSSTNYTHRERPENYDEDDERASDGEDPYVMDSRESVGAKDIGKDMEEERMSAQDLALARSLRLRAEGLEKVVTGMLDQPPPVHPHFDGDPLTPPSSPKRHKSHHGPQKDPHHPHKLPNGVRVRLTLGTIINDLFARQATPPPYRHSHPTVPITINGPSSDLASSRGNSPIVFKATSGSLSHIPNIESLGESMTVIIPPAILPLSAISAGCLINIPSMFMPSPEFQSPGFPSNNNAPHSTTHTPPPRVRELYSAGAEPSSHHHTLDVLRCPRHLFTGCEICVEAKTGGRPMRPRAASGGWNRSSPTKAGDSNVRSNPGSASKGSAGSGGGVTGWQDGSGIGSGLARPDVDGSVLRRRSWSAVACHESPCGTGAGNTKLSELIPRFLRMSALVAIELGIEARDEDGGVDQRARDNALRPSRAWYKLLVGLLTRAALEGYLTGGWHGTDAVECLMTVGLGMDDASNTSTPIDGSSTGDDGEERDSLDNSEIGDEFEWFDPDGFPTLREAARIMFPSLKVQQMPSGAQHHRREGAEADYEKEITERLNRFYGIPTGTPDLSTHMEDLAWHYPAEPIERAAVRYCEAVAKWRGKPELETYKKKGPPQSAMIMTIDSLVHSNPTSPTSGIPPPKINLPEPEKQTRPLIEKYFEEPFPGAWNRTGGKRRRSFVDDYDRGSKRFHM